MRVLKKTQGFKVMCKIQGQRKKILVRNTQDRVRKANGKG